MLLCMRTTLNLDPDLMRAAKELAVRSNKTLTEVIEDALRLAMGVRDAQPQTPKPDLVTSPGAPLPGVDLDDSAALLDLIEDDAAI